MKIYEKNDVYYLKEGNRYEIASIEVKPRTIVISGTGEFVFDLDYDKEYTFKELRKKIIGF